jgi:hypothetical protein
MADEENDVAELDRRWRAYLSQHRAASTAEVIHWLQTWGKPTFQKWRAAAREQS